MRIFIVGLILFFILSSHQVLRSQDFVSRNIDLGNTGDRDNNIASIMDDDLLYFISIQGCEENGEIIGCNSVSKIDTNLNVLKTRTFNWMNVNRPKPLYISGDSLLIVDASDEVHNPTKIRLLHLDKNSLDSLSLWTYEPYANMLGTAATAITIVGDYIVIGGRSDRLNNNEIEIIEYLIWIDATTMQVDTTIRLPTRTNLLSYGINNLESINDLELIVYADQHKVNNRNTRGFFRYDLNQDLLWSYEDKIDSVNTSQSVAYNHVGISLTNGGYLYKQESPESFDTYDVIKVKSDGSIDWVFDTSIYSPLGRKTVLNLKETATGDILGCGRISWHFNWDGIPPQPNSGFDFGMYSDVPYIFKLNGDSGELLWEYSLIEYVGGDGTMAPHSISQIYELENGNLLGAGSYVRRTELGGYLLETFDSWVIKMPADPCFNTNMECSIASFLSNTNIGQSTELGISIYPNPAGDYIHIETPLEVLYVSILGVSGNEILRSDHTDIIDLTSISKGIYIVQVFTEEGVASKKFLKL